MIAASTKAAYAESINMMLPRIGESARATQVEIYRRDITSRRRGASNAAGDTGDHVTQTLTRIAKESVSFGLLFTLELCHRGAC